MRVPSSGSCWKCSWITDPASTEQLQPCGKALKGEKLHFYFHFVSGASSVLSQALEGILNVAGGHKKISFFSFSEAQPSSNDSFCGTESTGTALLVYPEVNSWSKTIPEVNSWGKFIPEVSFWGKFPPEINFWGEFTPGVNSCRWEPLSSPWSSSHRQDTPLFHWHSHQPSVTGIYCCQNWMIINFMINILILKQIPEFIPYKYHPQVPPKASPAPWQTTLAMDPPQVLLLDGTIKFLRSLTDIVIPRAQWELNISFFIVAHFTCWKQFLDCIPSTIFCTRTEILWWELITFWVCLNYRWSKKKKKNQFKYGVLEKKK